MGFLIVRRPRPRRGFRGECCQLTVRHRLCKQPDWRWVLVDPDGRSSTYFETVNAPVPLRPAVLRFIPEPPGSSRFMDRDEPGENDVCLPKNLDGRPSRTSRPGSTPGHPGSSRQSPGRATVHPGAYTVHLGSRAGSPRSMPAEPRWRYGSSRFSTAELRSFPVHHGSSRRGENAV